MQTEQITERLSDLEDKINEVTIQSQKTIKKQATLLKVSVAVLACAVLFLLYIIITFLIP